MSLDRTTIIKRDSEKLLILACIFSVMQAASVVITTNRGIIDFSWIVESVLGIVMSFALYATYKSHVKNIMKPLLGAALMLILTYEVEVGCFYIQDLILCPQDYVGYVGSTALIGYAIVTILLFLVMLAINVMHYVINASHLYSPKKVKANNYLCIAFIILVCAQGLFIAKFDTGAVAIIGDELGCLCDIFFIGMIIIIENSLDEFRHEREMEG